MQQQVCNLHLGTICEPCSAQVQVAYLLLHPAPTCAVRYIVLVYNNISAILQMAALTSIFTKLKIISIGVSPYLNRTKCVQEDVLID